MLRAALRVRRRDVTASVVLYGTHQLGEAMVPVIIGATVSRAVDHGSPEAIAIWLAVLAADFAFLSLSFRFAARASMRARQHTSHAVRLWLTDRVVATAGGIENSPGDLLSRATSDTIRVGTYARMFASAIADSLVLLVATGFLLHYSLLLGTIILGGAILLIAVQSAVGRFVRSRSQAEQHAQALATALAENTVRGLRVLRGIGAAQSAAAEYAATSRRAVRAALRATSSASALSAAGALLSGLYLAVIAAAGGRLALTGRLGLGELVAALGLAQFVIGPMRFLAGAANAYARASASAGRVQEILDAPTAVVPGIGTPVFSSLQFVEVRPSGTDPPLSFEAHPAELTGIVCDRPAVAGAITALLSRELDPAAGEILLGGVDLRAAELDALRAGLLVSPHDAALLPGTVTDNLTALADRPAAVEAALADDIAASGGSLSDGAASGGSLSDGAADGFAGERGENLSGGQRQRVALARVLAASPPILVLHDPVTAVDTVTEDRIAERVRGLRAGRITLVVTTSPAWLSRCKQVVHAGADGCRTGTHSELLATDPVYRELVTR